MTTQSHAMGKKHAVEWLLESDQEEASSLVCDPWQALAWLISESGWDATCDELGIHGRTNGNVIDAFNEYTQAWDECLRDALDVSASRGSLICSHCNGSGEGSADGTRCLVCRGSGEVDDCRGWREIVRDLFGAYVEKMESGLDDNGGIDVK